MASSQSSVRFGLVILFLGGWLGVASAQTPGQMQAAHAIVAALPAADVPARCADLVANAPAIEQAAVAASLIPAVALNHPGALKATTIGISARVPKVAPAVAAAAVEVQPEFASEFVATLGMIPGVLKSEILTAVVAAAPQQASKCLKSQSSTGAKSHPQRVAKTQVRVPQPDRQS